MSPSTSPVTAATHVKVSVTSPPAGLTVTPDTVGAVFPMTTGALVAGLP